MWRGSDTTHHDTLEAGESSDRSHTHNCGLSGPACQPTVTPYPHPYRNIAAMLGKTCCYLLGMRVAAHCRPLEASGRSDTLQVMCAVVRG